MTTTPKAILFGSIGTLVEVVDMQRRSFNGAFEDAGLEWTWGREDYARLVRTPDEVARIAEYAEARELEVDAGLIHKAMVSHFRARALSEGMILRPGVEEVIAAAHREGVALAIASSAGAEVVDLVFEALGEQLLTDSFAFIGDRAMVEHGKPDPEIYQLALAQLELSPDQVIAIEDTPERVEAAIGAGLPCVAFMGIDAQDVDFPASARVVERLEATFFGLESAG